MNKLIQKGNITRELELRYTPTGTPVVDFGIAVNRAWKDSSGTKHEAVTFTDWRCWGPSAETLVKCFHKGKPILLEGRLEQDEWNDKQTGEKRRKTLGVVENWHFAGDTRTGGKASEPPPPDSSKRPAPPVDGQLSPEDDEIPF